MQSLLTQLRACLTGRFALFLLALAVPARATTVIGPWVPKFKGVDYSVSTNIPSGGEFPNFHVVHALRVDLADPDIRLHSTPRISDYIAGSREVGGLTVSDYLKAYGVQAAINANFFGPGDYYLPAGTPMDIYGLAVSEGTVVSAQDGPTFASTIVFDASNRATVIHTNWPATSVDGVFAAVSGEYSLVVDGKNVAYDLPTGGFIHRANPRTAFGVSQDRRFLYLVAIEGRQPGYSAGAYDYETAGWLLLLGAYDGMNVDGGGSTTLVIEDTTGVPMRLNRSSAVADSGRERTVGSHFGVFAKPLPGFINDVAAVPDDTTARITWTTVEPATSEVQYGLTSDLGNSSGVQSALVSSHALQLNGLTPDTGYYYRIISSTDSEQYVSSNFFFATTNYVTTNHIFGITNAWKYTTANLDGVDWTNPDYDDSAWSGPGPGLLWVDVSARGPNPSVEPKNTEMPANPDNGFPYATYYFRAHFVLTRLVQGSSLAFSGYVDDGAIFY
ncbi:MAG: phosphodiester glycosidase family protein, partial [Verrucomicrobiales bacterium]|nr:phosphodiester glycosidase family protein [Verrucomicrobiales bacterium]